MSLSAKVQQRYSTADLAAWTQINSNNNVTVDTDVLGYACDEAEDIFPGEVGAAYDETKASHVGLATALVAIILQERRGQTKADVMETLWKNWRERVKRVSAAGPRDRVTMVTNSDLTATDENPDGGTVYPTMDSVLDDVRPDKP